MNEAELLNDHPLGNELETEGSAVIYRRYCSFLVFGIIIGAATWLLLTYLQLGVPTISSRGLAWEYQHKFAYARSLPSPKVICVGGSGTLYGTRTELITERLGTPSVNFGTHAGLGIEYQLTQVKKIAQPGDIVLVSIEYESLNAGPPSDVLVNYVFARDPQYWLHLPLADRLRMAYTISPIRMCLGLSSRIQQPEKPKDDAYRATTRNANCDATNNTLADAASPLAQLTWRTNVYGALPELTTGPAANSNGRAVIIRFKDWCDAHRVIILATFPPTQDFPAYHLPGAKAEQDRCVALYKDIGIPTLGTPQDFFYPRTLLYDTPFHLNETGMTQHTKTLAGLLAPYLSQRKRY